MIKKTKSIATKKRSTTRKSPKKLTVIDRRNLNAFCVRITTDWDEAGTFIDSETAGRGHKQWRTDNLILHDPDDDSSQHSIVAGYFSKKKLELLLAQSGCNGVRIYYCKSRGTIGSRDLKYRDVFLMPTHDGIDMIPIKAEIRKPGRPIPHDENGLPTIQTTNGILNASTPCPDHCSKQYQK